MSEGVHLKIMQLLKAETNHEVALSCIRALGQLCLNSDTRVRMVAHEAPCGSCRGVYQV